MAALRAGGWGYATLPRWNAPPIFFSVASKRKRAVHGPKEKPLCGQKFSRTGKFSLNAGAVRDGFGINLPGFIRLRYTPAFSRTFKPQVGTLGVDLWDIIVRASASGPADATGAVILHWRGLRGMQLPVGADLRPKSRPAGGLPPKGGLRAALPTSALAYAAFGTWGLIRGAHRKGFCLRPADAMLAVSPHSCGASSRRAGRPGPPLRGLLCLRRYLPPRRGRSPA